ncbi:ABC transporter ATP-binding protein [Nonomuraea helvata]|uniref:ABC transporter ATP-binding protein n=1 Tax=Nonomuraea helvata TaxID=37484 RepID=A0ABV5RUI8_9ACTN
MHGHVGKGPEHSLERPSTRIATGAESAGEARWAVRLTEVRKTHGQGQGGVIALDNVSTALPYGTFTAIMGPSGSGKSTLLHCASGLERPDQGMVEVGGRDIGALSETALTKLRRERIGFVFQGFNLLPALTAEQNITLPVRLAGRRATLDRDWLERLIDYTGLGERRHHRPGELSGGQQQRVAIARALITRPDVVFADEPTGALDTSSGRKILELLRRLVEEVGQTVLMVTHDPAAASYADAVLLLADGRIIDVLRRPSAATVAERLAGLGV